jgi:hypothetical protein
LSAAVEVKTNSWPRIFPDFHGSIQIDFSIRVIGVNRFDASKGHNQDNSEAAGEGARLRKATLNIRLGL